MSTPCAACARRERITVTRDNYVPGDDWTLGLKPDGPDQVRCPACGLCYRHEVEPGSMIHDYDLHTYTRSDLPLRRELRVARCPGCGSTSARADAARGQKDLTWMQCDACGRGGLVDPTRRVKEWYVDLQLPEGAPLPPRLPT